MSRRITTGFHASVLAITLLLFARLPALAADAAEQQDIVDRARAAFLDFVADPNMGWFRDNVGDARGIFIVPNLVKAGFIFGGSGGSGVFLARDAQTGTWSYPAFYTMGSASFGLQAGAEVAQVVLLVMTDAGMDSFLSRSFKLGADASVAAGPVGAGAAVATADILSFSRAQGVFGGLTVSGAVIEPREDWDTAYYGRPVRSVDILVQRTVTNPLADPLRTAVASAARRL